MECLTFLKPFRSAHSGIEIQENAMNKSLCISPLLPQILKKKSFEIFCFKCQTQCYFPNFFFGFQPIINKALASSSTVNSWSSSLIAIRYQILIREKNEPQKKVSGRIKKRGIFFKFCQYFFDIFDMNVMNVIVCNVDGVYFQGHGF